MYSGPATGLWTSPNPFSAVPAGSLKTADNVVFTAPSVIEPRRGFDYVRDPSTGNIPAQFGTSASRADVIAFFGRYALVAFDLSKISWRLTGSFIEYAGDFVPNGNNRLRFEGAARSMFLNPADGIKVIDDAEEEPVYAGCPQGLNITAINMSGDGWQLGDTAVAYRFTVCRKDVWGRVIEGPPSGRTVLRNRIVSTFGSSGVTRAAGIVHVTTDQPHGLTTGDVVTLTPGEADFPAGSFSVTVTNLIQFDYTQAGANVSMTQNATWNITRSAELTLSLNANTNGPANFVRVYRSEMTATGTDVPSDEMFQCYESPFFVTALNALTFQDVTPESVLEVPLYTNPNTGDGTLAANFQPPIAEDLVYWQNRMWYLNTTSKHSAELALIGVGSPDGVQVGDVFTVLPAGGVLGVDNIDFTAVTGTPSPLQFQVFDDADPGYNIQRTAQSLIAALNDYAISDVDFPNAFYVSSETGQPGKMLLVAQGFGDTDGFGLYASRATCWTPQLPDNTTPLWAAQESNNNRHAARLYYSKLGQPEAVPLLNFEPIGADNAPALRMCALNYRLIIFKTDGVYFVPTGFPVSLQPLSDHVLVSPDSVVRLGDAIYFLSDQGLMMVDDSGVRPVSIPIDDTLTALGGPASLEDLQERTVAVPYRSARQYLLWTIEKDDVGAFSDDNAQAFVYSTLAAGFTRFPFGARAAAVCPADAGAGSDQLVVAPTNQNVLWIERKSLTQADYFDVDAAAIPVEVVFNELTNQSPATMKMTQQCSFLFKQNSVPRLEALFASEIHPEFVPDIYLDTAGWGSFPWGQIPWGGYVRTIRRVAPLPDSVANCCQLFVGFRASISGTKFQFLGIDVDIKRDTKANRG